MLGTKFALRANEDEAGVLVSRGAVRLVDESDRSVSVLAGEAGRIGARVRGVSPRSLRDHTHSHKGIGYSGASGKK